MSFPQPCHPEPGFRSLAGREGKAVDPSPTAVTPPAPYSKPVASNHTSLSFLLVWGSGSDGPGDGGLCGGWTPSGLVRAQPLAGNGFLSTCGAATGSLVTGFH